MGGIGSGTWERWSKQLTTDDCLSLDVRRVMREGLLHRPGAYRWFWRDDVGEDSISIYVRSRWNVLLDYRTQKGSSGPVYHQIAVRIEWQPCHYGGERAWFRCPDCGRRIALLYSVSGAFSCRHCHRLPYTSQREIEPERVLRRLWLVRARCGANGPIIRRPKGMHWRTFWRHLQQEWAIEEAIELYVARREAVLELL